MTGEDLKPSASVAAAVRPRRSIARFRFQLAVAKLTRGAIPTGRSGAKADRAQMTPERFEAGPGGLRGPPAGSRRPPPPAAGGLPRPEATQRPSLRLGGPMPAG